MAHEIAGAMPYQSSSLRQSKNQQDLQDASVELETRGVTQMKNESESVKLELYCVNILWTSMEVSTINDVCVMQRRKFYGRKGYMNGRVRPLEMPGA